MTLKRSFFHLYLQKNHKQKAHTEPIHKTQWEITQNAKTDFATNRPRKTSSKGSLKLV